MCGITGFIDFKGNSSAAMLRNMTDALTHRGPDDAGYFETDTPVQIGLGHRRLSIIDLSPLGHQPMHAGNGHWVIVFNGELYNYNEVREELIAAGYTFKSHSDTEVLLHAFDKWGTAAIHRFIGMFAFCLYDKTTQQVYCYRDRAGVKPFYYYWKDGLLLFGSELKAIHAHPGFKKELEPQAVARFLEYGYIPAPLSIFKHTQKLQPGHFLQIDLQKQTFVETQYWSVKTFYNKPVFQIDETTAIAEATRLLRSSCNYRMVADVPVGVFLSGGYDSSLVTALLQQDRTEKLRTFTIGFSAEKFNEAGYAREVAQYLGTDHTEYICTTKESQEIIPLLSEIFDEPFGDSSAIPTILVSRLARTQVTVALSADGGDEVFAGYNTYQHAQKIYGMLSKIPTAGLRKTAAAVLQVLPQSMVNRIFPSNNGGENYHKLLEMLRGKKDIITILDTLEQSASAHTLSKLYPGLGSAKRSLEGVEAGLLNTMLAFNYTQYMVDDVLVKVDRAAMSVSLEGREPLLDHRLAEWAAQLPADLKRKDGKGKYLLRQITHQLLPEAMMDRPKMGFGIPLHDWFRGDLKYYFDEYLSESRLSEHGLFSATHVRALLAKYEAGSNEHFQLLWYLLMFQMWYEKWMR
jgi:asparagine synthase (glutamine-hydrolysing)